MNIKYINLLILIFILVSQKGNAQKIAFKDENLKSALLELGYDFNKNSEIEVSEIDTITKLKISKRNIKQLDDLKHFKSLKTVNANDNQIQNLDVFFDNTIIEEIYVGGNHLGKKLILRNLPKLKRLYAFENKLEEMDLIDTDNIQLLYLQDNLFEKIEFKNLLNLTGLQMTGNKKLKDIDISNNKKLGQLYLTHTPVSKLDITNNPLLKILYVEKSVQIVKSNAQSNFKPMPKIEISN